VYVNKEWEMSYKESKRIEGLSNWYAEEQLDFDI
jgi:hypothetical protein